MYIWMHPIENHKCFLRNLLCPKHGRRRRHRRVSMVRDNSKKFRPKRWKNVNYETIMLDVWRQHDSRGSNTLFITTYYEIWALVFKCFGENSNKQIIAKRYASLFAPFVISHRMSCEHQSGTSTIIQMYTLYSHSERFGFKLYIPLLLYIVATNKNLCKSILTACPPPGSSPHLSCITCISNYNHDTVS